jgi:glutathione synthase/RimK-type ligase-like ATP-grasp enzyme
MLAIHNSPTGFHPRWIAYCERNGIPHKRVDCHASDIIKQVEGCDALMWHHSQSEPKDILIARPVLSALEHAGIRIFPDFRTAWHFDDKVAQKYLFEALDIPTVPAHVFVDREEALEWVDEAEFPKVFKLRRGAGSAGVKLINDRAQARRMVKKAFGRGFPVYDPWDSLKERVYKWRLGKYPVTEVFKGLARFVNNPRYSRILGRERGYVYFQDFAPGNSFDTRVFVTQSKACGLRRNNRPNDFRASGSGRLCYEPELIECEVIQLAFYAREKIGATCLSIDLVFDYRGKPRIIEVSYGSPVDFYDRCPGYWDSQLNWHSEQFDPQGWMVERVLDLWAQ